MILVKPKGILTQGVAENANPLYHSQGLLGHTGDDFVNYHLAPIESACDGYVYKILPPVDFDQFTGVFVLVEDDGFVYEILYGHLIPDETILNTNIKLGTIVGKQCNYGETYVNGVRVTKEEKLNGSTAGSHLHFQVRKCKKSLTIEQGKQYLTAYIGAIYRKDGYCFEIIDYNNGLNGCIVPVFTVDPRIALATQILSLLKQIIALLLKKK